MASIRALSGSSGGGDNTIYRVQGTLVAPNPLNVNITGKAKNIYLLDSNGYLDTNTNPTTGEISDSALWETTVSGTHNWNKVSLTYFIRTNGNISTNTSLGNTNYILLYTVE